MKNENTNIYIVFKYSAYKNVKDRLEYIKENNPNIIFFNFYDAKDNHWKKKAKDKIRNCAFVLFFYDNYFLDDKKETKNIKYELNLVKEYKKKLITVYTSSKEEVEAVSKAIKEGNIDEFYKKQKQEFNPQIAKVLFGTDFSELNVSNEAFRPINIVDGKNRVLEYSEWSVENSINNKDGISEKSSQKDYYELLMKQYELMIQTSENLIQRRSEMSDKYRNTCIALISLVTSSIALGNLLLTGLGMVAAGLICALVSKHWKASLIEFSRNNEGKYAVINAIEKKLPANMFDTEYTYNTFKGIRTYSVREMSFPKTFKIVGIVLAIIGLIVFGCAIWALIVNKTFNLFEIFKLGKE